MESENVSDQNPPDPIIYSGRTGEWDDYQERLFDIFQQTVVNGKLIFLGLPVKVRWFEPFKGKHFTFWHLISEGEKESERTPDLRRCERIGWIQWCINNYESHPDIVYGVDEYSSQEKDYRIWYEKGGYLIVLSKRNGYFLLKTAYLPRPRKVMQLQKDFATRKKKS